MSRAEHITMDFINPTVNDLTLNFPEPPPEEVLKAAQNLAYEAALELDAQRRTIEKAAVRKARRTRQRLEASAVGGFTFIQPDPLPFDLDHNQTSTRGQRRRKKLGRA